MSHNQKVRLHYCTNHNSFLTTFCKCRQSLSAFHGPFVCRVQSDDMSVYPSTPRHGTASSSRPTRLESRFLRGFPDMLRPDGTYIWQTKQHNDPGDQVLLSHTHPRRAYILFFHRLVESRLDVAAWKLWELAYVFTGNCREEADKSEETRAATRQKAK